jgi:enoyl-CoA hydratase
MPYQHLLITVKDHVATLTFNRPESLNALNSELLDELADYLDGLAADNDVWVLVLTGSGDKAFVAGADINELARCNALTGKLMSEKGQGVIAKLQALPIPVIAAVNGYALGGGCEIALGCDFIYAAESAMLGLPEITLGLIPGFGGTQRLARRVGIGRAKELIFTGQMITAAEAMKIGLINRVLPTDELEAAVDLTARSLCQKGRVALRAAKTVINAGLNADLETGCALEVDAFALCMASTDAKEGTSAFLQKRKPDFKGTLEE